MENRKRSPAEELFFDEDEDDNQEQQQPPFLNQNNDDNLFQDNQQSQDVNVGQNDKNNDLSLDQELDGDHLDQQPLLSQDGEEQDQDQQQMEAGSEQADQLSDAEEEQEEEGELEQEEGTDNQQAEEEGEEEMSESLQKDTKISRLLDDESGEDEEEDDDDHNSDNDQRRKELARNTMKNEARQDTVVPQKRRGRPSKRAQFEQKMQERQSRASKRVRFQLGEGDASQDELGDLSEEVEGEEDKEDGQIEEDYATGYRENQDEFAEYVKNMKDEHNTTVFEVFTQQRRKQVYESLKKDTVEEERFNAFNEACPKKTMKKKIYELIYQLPGQKLKVTEDVIQVITSAVKSHSGQLIETAKKIQIDEIKQRLAMQYPHRVLLQDEGKGPLIEDKEFLVNGTCMSKEAQEAFVNEIRDMGPCQPHHMQEARRLLEKTDAAVSDRPKSMFLRKRHR